MANDSEYQHHQWACYHEKWLRARDVIEGEDTIKNAGERYLPMLDQQTPEEYKAYKDRTKFLGATGRTLEGLHGMIFRKNPLVVLPKEGENKANEMADFEKDVTLQGESLNSYSKNVVREVLSVGRGGTLVDFQSALKRSYFSFYTAENIWHWQTGLINGKVDLKLLILHEEVSQAVSDETIEASKPGELLEIEEVCKERLRICLLKMGPSGVPALEIRIFEKSDNPDDKTKYEWAWVQTIVPVRNGIPLPFIPFVFHNATDCLPCCSKLPLEDIISVNLHHYRLSADYNHALHFTAVPTAWVAGFPKETKLRIGSSVAWVSENVDAKAGYLEYSGKGLNPIKDALDDDKKDMAVLGARLLEEQKKDSEAAETVRIRQAGESSVLSNVANSASTGLSYALKIAFWWISTEVTVLEIDNETVAIKLNSDFIETRMSSEELTAIVNAWQRGAISQSTMLHNFRNGELLPAGRSDEEEISLIESDAQLLNKLRADEAKAVSAGAAA